MGVQTTTRDNGSPSFLNIKISSVTGLNEKKGETVKCRMQWYHQAL